MTDLKKVLNESLIRVGKSNKASNIFEVFQNEPVYNCFDFSEIYSNLFFSDKESKEFNF